MLTTATVPGVVQEQYDYDAFGLPYFYTASGGKFTSIPHTRFLFTGREWLRDLRIYDYRARQYQPELGRFLQPDPKEFGAGDYNLYRYCHNDPVNKMDPTGTDPVAAAAIVAAGLTLAAEEEAFGLLTPPAQIAAGLTITGALVYAGIKYFQAPAAHSEPKENAGDKPKAGDVPTAKEIEGKSEEEVGQMMEDKGWKGESSREGGGTRYSNPDKKGEQVRTQPGNTKDPNPAKQGPYGRISSEGQKSDPIPLKDNPILRPNP